MANAIRFLAIDAVEKANSGHPGLPLGTADIATSLYRDIICHNPQDPNWPNRDRFILSAGHGSMLLYSLLYLTGYQDITIDEIKNFRQLGAKTAGHPEYGHAAGIETTTGPLGQGLANAVGMAIAESHMRATYGEKLFNHYTYVLAGDGCLMEGISQEAISLAGHLKLNKLIVIWDDNNITIDGQVSLADSTDQSARFLACNWNVIKVDGHCQASLTAALQQAKQSDKPTLIAAKTTIGYGCDKAGTNKVHGAPLGAKSIENARLGLAWPHQSFDVPSDILQEWRTSANRCLSAYEAWQNEYAKLSTEQQAELARRLSKQLPTDFDQRLLDYKNQFIGKDLNPATRKASEMSLGEISQILPEMIGGSADLTGSNNTKTSQQAPIQAGDFSGHYIYYGIREHAMAAIMNGLALYGGIIPYGGTFMCFSDYMRPSMRLSSLMGLRVIYVLTHDSIGLGEDGPTHQPIEHLASLRAIPNHQVFRPADLIETIECWQAALSSPKTPSSLALSRQNLPSVRKHKTDSNLAALGAYILSEPQDKVAEVSIFASGSEVQIALEAQKLLQAESITSRVISVPCFELFAQQDANYKNSIIGGSEVKIAIEAGIKQGWDVFIGSDGLFIGMDNFGASGTIDDLYQHFGITAEAIVAKVKTKLQL